MKVPTPYQGNESYIFAGFAPADADAVLEMIAVMQENGFRVWFEQPGSPGGRTEEIACKLQNCGCFISFLSERWLASARCDYETSYARALGKDRLLVYLEALELPIALKLRLGRLRAIHRYRYLHENEFYETLFEADEVRPYRAQPPAGTP